MSEIMQTKGYGRALSEMDSSNSFLDPNTIVEISREETNTSSKSYKATLSKIDEAIIDDFALYNNLNHIFDSTKHPRDTYFENNTTFKENPFVHEENIDTTPASQNLITKNFVDKYLAENGICIPTHLPNSDYYYYSAERREWVKDNNLIPMVLSPTMDGIWTSFSKVGFNYGTNVYAFTDDITTPKNIMLDVTGNIVLEEDYQKDWYEENQNFFVALTINGNIITLQFLKNILLMKKDEKTNYVIAQFHFHCPLAKNTTFKIITNAECKLFGMQKKDPFSRKLYNSLNAVNLGFYDFAVG